MVKSIHRLIREKNRTLNRWEQYYRKDELESFPITIQFPTGTRCNLKCRFCTNRAGEKATTDYANLSFGKFRSIIEHKDWKQALRCISSIALYGWGEPLFNRDYEKIFDYIAGDFPGLGIGICTNGIMFNRKWSEKILAIDNSDVNFSVDAATKETFRNLKSNDQFEQVIANIRGLTNLREECRKKNPLVSLSFVANTENIKELPQFVNLAADLKADCILVQDIMILNEETERLSLMNEPDLAYRIFNIASEQARVRQIPFSSFVTHQVDHFLRSPQPITEQNIYSQTIMVESVEVPSPYFASTDCFDPWEKIMISSESGEVYPCCRFQSLPDTSLGNIYKQSFHDIWNGNAYRSLRSVINTENPPPVCAICPRKADLD